MAARKWRPNHRSPGAFNSIASLRRLRLSLSVTCGIFSILIITVTVLICYEAQYILLHTKTVAGDNLEPTPWHGFAVTPPTSWSLASRFPKILTCHYLSCLKHSLIPLERTVILSNDTRSCPKFFQWIYEDLAPWRSSKVSLESLKAAQSHAAFRVVIVGGRLYTEFYYACVAPRAMFTLWGILQLLDKYPGLVPDVDLMFDCMDRPVLMKADYKDNRPPPPLFRYCGTKDSLDIPFPDWTFWGWPETDIRPWTEELENIYKASKSMKWENRDPSAFWKGNPDVGSPIREELLKCNSSEEHDWRAQIFRQDWGAAFMSGYTNSKLADQCKHKFKIYAEGHAWSVSFKYILACDSPVLVPTPTYHEFFMRALIPRVHYWPIHQDELCPSIKFAVDWGDKHSNEAKAIGKTGQDFVRENLMIDHVYDYMFHLLSEYAKLQNFQPVVPPNSQMLCKSSILCFNDDPKTKDFLKRSEVKVSEVLPCSLAAYDMNFISDLEERQQNNTREIRAWEDMARRESKS